MRHISESDPLQALKDSVRDLDNLKLLSPTDLEILDLRRNLKKQIAALERQQCEGPIRHTEQSSDHKTAA